MDGDDIGVIIIIIKLYFCSIYINNCSRRFIILLKYIKIQFKNYNNKRMNSSTNNNKNNK